MAARAADAPPPIDLSMIDDREPLTAQQVADLAAGARTRGDIDALKERGRADGIDPADMVCPDQSRPDRYVMLRDYLGALQRRLPEAVPGE